jgi:hypothetical protein
MWGFMASTLFPYSRTVIPFSSGVQKMLKIHAFSGTLFCLSGNYLIADVKKNARELLFQTLIRSLNSPLGGGSND